MNLCRNSTDPLVGLGLYEDNDSFKCYMADTGLLVSQAFADRETTPDDVYRDILFDKLSLNEGMLVENAVAQQFRANGRKLYFFSRLDRADASKTMEIDFLIVREYDNAAMKPRISPIEVKSTKRYGVSSLDKFRKGMPNDWARNTFCIPANSKWMENASSCRCIWPTVCDLC